MYPIYTVGKAHPVSATAIKALEEQQSFLFPEDYRQFIMQYGYGELNELLMLTAPDADFINNNFSDCMDIWDWETDAEQKALQAITIGRTVDGDIIAITDDRQPFLLLPRHSTFPRYFASFADLIAHYNQQYQLNNELYFDTYYQAQRKYLPLHATNQPDPELMQQVHQRFLSNYIPDEAFNLQSQPKYILQSIGGWVYFDLIHNGAIRIKYQEIFEERAKELEAFLRMFFPSK